MWVKNERFSARRWMGPLIRLGFILGLLSLSGCATSYYLAGKEAMADFHPPARMDADCDALGLHVNEVVQDVRGFSMEGVDGPSGCLPCGLLMLGGYEYIEARQAEASTSRYARGYGVKPGLYRYTLVARTVENEATCKRFDEVNEQRASVMMKYAKRHFGGPSSHSDRYNLKDEQKLSRIVGGEYKARAKKYCVQAAPIKKFTAPYHARRLLKPIRGGEMADNEGVYQKNSYTLYRQSDSFQLAELVNYYEYRLQPRFGPPLRRMCISKSQLNLPALLVPVGKKRLKQTQTLLQSIRGAE